ncbi:MAG: YbaN family protein [Prevotellaceae bacterium]|nr:YbaN family protein [Prevotellaceae bacterium]
MKILLIIFGSLSLGLGIIGIFVPGLPVTPFVLLAAGCYVRSSNRLYEKLIANKLLGKYIVDFNEKKGMSRKAKIQAIVLMWTMILLSTIFLIDNSTVRIVVLALGVVGAVVVGFCVRTVE